MSSTKLDPVNRPLPGRERLLESAKILFSIHGYENTSTAAIARHANTSESQLIKHFGSKEGLLAITAGRILISSPRPCKCCLHPPTSCA